METKVCTKCGRELPRTSFYVNKHQKDGLQSYCKECHCKATTEAARIRRKKAKAEEEASKTAPVLPVVSVMDMGCIYNLAQVEKQTIISCVNNNPNKTFTEYAELLGISERSFYRKIHQYDLREVVNTVRSYSEMEMADAISGVHLAKVKTLADYEDKDLLEELWKRDYDGNIWKMVRKETTISKLFGKKK